MDESRAKITPVYVAALNISINWYLRVKKGKRRGRIGTLKKGHVSIQWP